MTGFKKLFLDTAPIIYFLDEDINFGNKARMILEEVLTSGITVCTSVITYEEYLVQPYKKGNIEKAKAFEEFLHDFMIPVFKIDIETAKKAALIRSAYNGFKGMDSLQLASACSSGCDLFLTNDKQLRQFKDMKCITIDEWITNKM